jgi:hypothetical protein
MKALFSKFSRILMVVSILIPQNFSAAPMAASAVVYYVSSSAGSDTNTGTSQGTPFQSVTKVNSLNLQPGDQVLFKCGDTWRADPLILTHSGTAAAPIQFGSYPFLDCANKPALSGSRPITGWTLNAPNVYQAALPAADFPSGVNQLFRSGARLALGRWPNLDAPNAGYSFVDAHTAGGSQITDNELPAGNWNGAIVHIKNIRWSMLDRQVTGTSAKTLTLNTGLSCLVSAWGSCAGWGFFINNSRITLDRDGEWYYDPSSRLVYLYSTPGVPAEIEGSVVPANASDLTQGGLMLSGGGATAFVIVDNLEIKNWFNHGIGTPGGMVSGIYHDVTLRNLAIRDVDGAGANLSSWLQNPPDGIQGLRGGYNLIFEDNLIEGANAFGITGYFASSTFIHNTLRNIALLKNLGKSGMGCGLTSGECTENGDGFRIRQHMPANSGFGNTLNGNYFEKIGYNGVDVFGPETTLENNVISESCFTKADCGGVRVFGDHNLATTPVYNIHLVNNLILNIPGNVDGCHASLAAFGMGLYVDNYSRNVETRGNTVVNTTVSGILYQRSTGQIVGNTVFNASSGTEFSAQIDLGGGETLVTMSKNQVYGLKSNAWTLYASSLSNILSSDYNAYFQPYVSQQIAYGPSWARKTFSQWQTFSGQDAHSNMNWFTQPVGETSRGQIFYNQNGLPLTINLGVRQYLDLNQTPLLGSLTLPPYSSKILVDNGPAPLTVQSVFPDLLDSSKPADFTLTVNGMAFTPSSVVRWNGANQATAFVNSSRLTAEIPAALVSSAGNFQITVWDPGSPESNPITVHVALQLYYGYFAQVFR